MTDSDIIRLAREAGIPETATEGVFIANSDDLGRLIAAEREECAKIAESADDMLLDNTFEGVAKAIRARGQMINGMTEDETNKTMSVRGLNEK